MMFAGVKLSELGRIRQIKRQYGVTTRTAIKLQNICELMPYTGVYHKSSDLCKSARKEY